MKSFSSFPFADPRREADDHQHEEEWRREVRVCRDEHDGGTGERDRRAHRAWYAVFFIVWKRVMEMKALYIKWRIKWTSVILLSGKTSPPRLFKVKTSGFSLIVCSPAVLENRNDICEVNESSCSTQMSKIFNFMSFRVTFKVLWWKIPIFLS